MDDTLDLSERQIAAFTRYLELMLNRRKKVDGGDSFIIFQDEDPGAKPADVVDKSRAKDLALMLAAGNGVLDLSDRDIILPGGTCGDDHCEGGSGGSRHPHYVQLCFQQCTFFMDLPTPVITPCEAEQLMARRSGFFWLRNRRPMSYSMESWKEIIKNWNPVRKEYINSDARSAAEDIAFIWFRLWKYPPNWQFWYQAHTFHDNRKHDWEGDYPVRTAEFGWRAKHEPGGNG